MPIIIRALLTTSFLNTVILSLTKSLRISGYSAKTSKLDLKEKIESPTKYNIDNGIINEAVVVKSFFSLIFFESPSKKLYTPIAATNGIKNSIKTWIDETALNLLYKGI